MAQAGDRIENPATGERVTFIHVGADLLELELEWPRPGRRAAAHIHPEMEERYEVLEGTAEFRVGGEERTAAPGEVVTVPPGTLHEAWNPTERVVRLHVQFRPPLRWAEFITKLFAAMHQPDEADLPALLREYRREIVLPG